MHHLFFDKLVIHDNCVWVVKKSLDCHLEVAKQTIQVSPIQVVSNRGSS